MPETHRGARFDRTDWAEADLSDWIFDDCSFEEVVFTGADLREARFENCRLVRCNFTHADLREARFENIGGAGKDAAAGCRFAYVRGEGTRFKDCDLSHAAFDGADLYDVGFENTRLLGARFHRARFERVFSKTRVETRGRFRDCNLELADLAELALSTCDFTRSRLREADLRGADLTEALLKDTDFFLAEIDGAKLDGADARGADFTGLDLRRLQSYAGLRIDPAQQYALLEALGVSIEIDD